MSLQPGRSRGEPDNIFTLRLISYGRSAGPLMVEDTSDRIKLTYSVRDVPNPPNLMRKKYTGMSPRIQKEIFATKEGKTRLEQIVDNIEIRMMEMTEDYSRAPSPEPTVQNLYPPKESPRELVVAIMCEEGRHRSVAFAEELSKDVTKRRDWVIDVQHRDLGVIASSEDEDTEEDDEDGSISPSLSRTKSKTHKQKDKERKKMLGRRISSVIDVD